MSDAIDRLIARLTDNYAREAGTNNYRLLTVAAEQHDDVNQMLLDVLDAHFVSEAVGDSLDNIGVLINEPRERYKSGILGVDLFDVDSEYRGRLKTKLQRFQGGGSLGSLYQVLVEFIENVKAPDGYGVVYFGTQIFVGPNPNLEIDDGYLTTQHVAEGDHYAHIMIYLLYGVEGNFVDPGEWDAARVAQEIDKARAVGITVDGVGPKFLEKVGVRDQFFWEQGFTFRDFALVSDSLTIDFGTTFADAVDVSDVGADIGVHRTDITFTDSLNWVG